MRKTIIVLALSLFAITGSAHAQTPAIGIRGGLNLANFGGERVIKSGHVAGPTLGAYLSIPISATLAIQPEILFSRKGGSRTAYDDSDMPAGEAPPIAVYINGRATSDYLEIPLLFKLDAADPGDLIRPVFFAGPSMGFLLRTKSDWHGSRIGRIRGDVRNRAFNFTLGYRVF